MATRTVSLTIKLTEEEAELLARRAAESGLALRPYVRGEMLRTAGMPRHLALVLLQLGRMDELARRIWSAAAADELRPDRLAEIAAAVDAVDERVLLARAGVTL